jgi:hypothetical protein
MKFNSEVKEQFIKVYNDPKVASKDLHVVLTELGHKQGWLEPSVEFKANVIRDAFEVKLGLKYKNRKRKVAEEIEFETGEEVIGNFQVLVTEPVETEEETTW